MSNLVREVFEGDNLVLSMQDENGELLWRATVYRAGPKDDDSWSFQLGYPPFLTASIRTGFPSSEAAEKALMELL